MLLKINLSRERTLSTFLNLSNMKIFFFTIISVFNTIHLFAQCSVDAGKDIFLCIDKNKNIQNTPNLEAIVNLGIQPYKVKWSTNVQVDKPIFSNDSNLKSIVTNYNGILGLSFITIYVSIIDSVGNLCKDSLRARLSYFAAFPDFTERTIKKGDTITIYSIVGKGIPPLQRIWNPQSYILNSNLPSPKVFPNVNAKYSCTTIDSLGCISDWEDSWTIFVDTSKANINFNLYSVYIKNFHNPIFNNTVFDIDNLSQINSIKMFNFNGQLIAVLPKQKSIEIGKITPNNGVYFIIIYLNDGQKRIYKVIKE